MNSSLLKLLQQAWSPCPLLESSCKSIKFCPSKGFAPRGICGANGKPEEVELILIFAEPGDPHESESFSSLDDSIRYTEECYRSQTDLFHKRVRLILDMCFPGLTFDQQLCKSLLTDSVLCSAEKESGTIPIGIEKACVTNYLLEEIKLFPNAVVCALGGKSQRRLRKVGFNQYVSAFSAAPPGCNYKGAHASWEKLAAAIHSRG
ncbi:hypothetical protein [Vulcanococcus sp. Clear-D1]|uniref:hypothetical protein n=1 Tax=Vulcanococcus sp. Clear-D1 TaxID=2766970 RepID=UPI0019A16DDC|nr:hypothetical protein [Vulcanococcus sp. Clear-D1]MBD1193118.1 hypothetical protein [Vulcanococcus sp. Clear-D1]